MKIPMEFDRHVIISLDGYVGYEISDDVLRVHEVAKVFLETYPRQVRVITHSRNLGLQEHLVSALRNFFLEYPSGIIFEDDIIPTRQFFTYMDYCLERFEYNSSIFAINGWTPFLQKDHAEFSHITRYFVSWGWGTWANRFALVDFELRQYSKQNWWKLGTVKGLKSNLGFKRYWTKRFNIITSSYENKSWDWEFLSEMWRLGGFCISPPERLVTNVGYDQLASHPNFGSERQKAAAREVGTSHCLLIQEKYNPKLDLKYERLMWDLGWQRVISSIQYRSKLLRNLRFNTYSKFLSKD